MFAQHRRAMVLAAMFATAISAALGGGPSADAYVDTEYGVKVTPPAVLTQWTPAEAIVAIGNFSRSRMT